MNLKESIIKRELYVMVESKGVVFPWMADKVQLYFLVHLHIICTIVLQPLI